MENCAPGYLCNQSDWTAFLSYWNWPQRKRTYVNHHGQQKWYKSCCDASLVELNLNCLIYLVHSTRAWHQTQTTQYNEKGKVSNKGTQSYALSHKRHSIWPVRNLSNAFNKKWTPRSQVTFRWKHKKCGRSRGERRAPRSASKKSIGFNHSIIPPKKCY